MSRTRISVLLGVVGALALVACSSDEPSSSTGGATIAGGSTDQPGTTTTTAEPADDGATTTTAESTSGSTTSTTATTGTTVGRVVDDPSDNVHSGDSGPGVEQIQYILTANGYDLPVDGEFGPVTETAIRDFQKKNGLTVDGVVGPITWATLQASIGTATTTSAGATTTSADSAPSTTS